MDPRATRKLGSASLQVTRMGFGGGPLGGFRGRIVEEEAVGTVRTAYDAGLRYLDTSPYYGYGRSELRFGHVLRDLPRESYVLSTKVGRWLTRLRPDDDREGLRAGGLPFRPTFDYSYDGAMRSLEQSYLRLGVAGIDVVYIHDVDAFTHGDAWEERFGEAMAGCYRALVELKGSGEIKAIGVGINDIEPCLRFAREADLDCMLLAGRYTLLEQGALDELLPLCQKKEIGVVIGGPFNSGVLVTGPVEGATYDYRAAPADVMERVGRIKAVCDRHDVPMAAAALQFPLGHPAVSSVIPGAMSRAEVLQNVDWMGRPIPGDLWAELKRAGLMAEAAPTPAAEGVRPAPGPEPSPIMGRLRVGRRFGWRR
ncbi:MAG TPA: aldo/keto reductase [Geminicoccaceae bacterium]|nr:aldo/keto reductase [Geminicoccaceae bacterium]